MRTNKILLVIFVFFLILVLGEASYLVLLSSRKQPEAVLSSPNIVAKATPTPTPFVPRVKPNEEAVMKGNLDYLYELRRGITKSLVLTATYEGKVLNVDTVGGVYTGISQNENYLFSMTLVDDKAEGNTTYLNDIDIKKAIVKKKSATTGVLTDASLKDIKVGQTLEEIKKSDLYYTKQNKQDYLISLEMFIIE